MATQVNNTAWLEWIANLMGAGSRQTQTAALPPDQFHCLLDELPLHLIPRRQLESQRTPDLSDRPLFLNPQCSVLPPGQVPPELGHRRDLLAKFNLQKTVAWVRDPTTGSLLPFWLGQRLEPLILSLRLGEPIPNSVSAHTRALLNAAGILSYENEAERRISAWSAIARDGASQFKSKGYAPLSNLIHPFHIAALRRYCRHEIRRGAIRLGDEQSSRRYAAHNESVARFFHYQIASAVSAIVGEAIKPSYVYLASYLPGAELKKHTDRAQCQFSVTLCLDFSPEPELATSWPIRLDTQEGKISVYQALGDGLLYRGTQVPHYRNVLAPGHMSTSIFFHYVPANFPGSLE
jgi:hypothetical protein